MLQINEDKSIYITRGDVAEFSVIADIDGQPYTFTVDNIVRISVYAKKNCTDVVLRKDFTVDKNSESIDIYLDERDTRIGPAISKPTDYWYEVELNPLTNPQTIIGYDEDGAKVFKLFPEGDNSGEITEKDIPVVDKEFSTESERPLQNGVITQRFNELQEDINEVAYKITSKDIITVTQEEWDELYAKGTWKANTVYVIEGKSVAPDSPEEEEDLSARVEQAIKTSNTAISQSSEALRQAQASAKTVTYQASVPYTKWKEDAVNGGYTCTVTVAGILSTDNPIADVVLDSDIDANALKLDSWSKVIRIATSDDNINLYAYSEPDTNLTIQLKVVR